MTIVRILLAALVASGLLLVVRWTMETRRVAARGGGEAAPTALDVLIGFVTNFFDTLGIGSFATTTAVFRLFRLVPDELIPGTLIAGDALPVLAQALLFISVVEVDPWQMTALIAVCVAGGWIGAGIVASLSRRAVQFGMGVALLVAAVFMMLGMLGQFPSGGTALAFTPWAFALALGVNFVLGALLTLGIGSYAPSLVLFSLLGMDPQGRLSDHDGVGCIRRDDCGRAVRQLGPLSPACRVWVDRWRNPRSGRGGVARQVAPAWDAARSRADRRCVRLGDAPQCRDSRRCDRTFRVTRRRTSSRIAAAHRAHPALL